MVATNAAAHHSAAMFDHGRLVKVTGVVKAFSYQAPHSWVSVIGATDGKPDPVQWDVEAVSPGTLARMGVTKDTFKPGDKVVVLLYPLRDGRNAGSMLNITNARGETFGPKPGEPPEEPSR